MSGVTDAAPPTAETTPAPTAATTTTPIVARRSWHYTVTKMVLMPVLIGGMGVLFLKDGFFTWPAVNAAYRAAHPGDPGQPHTDFDIQLQKILCCFLIPAGVALFAWFLHRSRGAYTFDGQTLGVPGHPPVPTAAMQRLDRSRWDRKGIALVTYHLPDAAERTLTLDGYVYEQAPTDLIFARIEALFTAPPATAADAPADDDAPGDPAADGGSGMIADV